MDSNRTRSAGHALVEQLVSHGVERVYGVPGESYLDVLDGLYEYRDQIQMVVTRQEGGAAMMAAAHGQLTGKPGVCMVTRGPGATNASIGVHIASQDASPMVLCIGQVPRDAMGQQSFQEVDYHAMFGGMAKEVLELNTPDRAVELVARAMNVAVSGEPGPVVLVLPEDVLLEQTTRALLPQRETMNAVPSEARLDEAARLLSTAERPVIIAAKTLWDHETSDCLQRLAERHEIPVASAVRRQDVLDNESPAYAGCLGLNTTPGLGALVSRADVVVFLGARADALTMAGVEFNDGPGERTKIIHVYPNENAIGRVYPVDIATTGSSKGFVQGIAEKVDRSAAGGDWYREMRGNFIDAMNETPETNSPGDYMAVFNRYFDADTIVTVGAGNYCRWPQRFRQYRRYDTQIGSYSGAMGYGVPAAVAAAFERPAQQVVAFAGDGCFLMNGQELSTIHRYQLNVFVVIVNNQKYETIRKHQDRQYPGRVSGTDLENPDFVKLAESYGGVARRVASAQEFDAALSELRPRDGLRVIEIEHF